MMMSPARAFVPAGPAVLRPRDLYMPAELIAPPPLVIDPFDWRADFVDRFMARSWDGRWTKMILPGIGACIVGAANDGAYVRLVVSTGTTGTLLVPLGFDPPTGQLQLLGSGGYGGIGGGSFAGGGGASGQYWGLVTGVSLTPGSSYSYQRGVPGVANAAGSPSAPLSNDTWFNNAISFAYAQGGMSTAGAAGVGGGIYSPAVGGGTTHNGANGWPQQFGGTCGAAGAGAPGPNGDGKLGGNVVAGSPIGGPGGGGANNGSVGTSSIAGNSNGQAGGNNHLGTGGGVSVLPGVNGSNGADGGGGAGSGAGATTSGSGGIEDLWDGYGPSGGSGGTGSSGVLSGTAGWGAGTGGTANGGTVGTPFGGLITLRWTP
jgi:hypothetical protein